MKKLDLKKLSNDTAFETLSLSGAALDTAIAAKAQELTLADVDYPSFKGDVQQFRQMYLQAAGIDANEAKAAAAKLASKPTPAPAPANPIPTAPQVP